VQTSSNADTIGCMDHATLSWGSKLGVLASSDSLDTASTPFCEAECSFFSYALNRVVSAVLCFLDVEVGPKPHHSCVLANANAETSAIAQPCCLGKSIKCYSFGPHAVLFSSKPNILSSKPMAVRHCRECMLFTAISAQWSFSRWARSLSSSE
jgi:hypothetical protein